MSRAARQPGAGGGAVASGALAADATTWSRDADRPIWRGRAMATDILFWMADAAAAPDAAARAAHAAAGVFARVERECTRFDIRSPLMRLNASPGVWKAVPEFCYRALATAVRAWRRTDGRFDPRVLTALERLGYRQTLDFDRGGEIVLAGPETAGPETAGTAGPAPAGDGPFLERRPRRREVRLVDGPLDLGGVGKGLAVRWAAALLQGASANFLIDAGGDCFCRGSGPEGDSWRIAVEDPAGGHRPVAVLALREGAVCTSSIRRRRWRSAGENVHHLIDPRTGGPARGGLSAVTVAGSDAAWAEVWSKALFVEGRAGAGRLAAARRLAALWVGEDGMLGWSPHLTPHLLWIDPSRQAAPAAGGRPTS